MKTIRLGIVALCLAMLITGSVSFALATSEDATCTRQLISSGATHASAGTLRLAASLGQPVVANLASNDGQITLTPGFRHGGLAHYVIYLPLTVKSGN